MHLMCLRLCEYDETTMEYWVNTRTEGSLKREDVERLSRKRSFEQDAELDDFPTMDMNPGGFENLGAAGNLTLEGDAHKTATRMQVYKLK